MISLIPHSRHLQSHHLLGTILCHVLARQLEHQKGCFMGTSNDTKNDTGLSDVSKPLNPVSSSSVSIYILV
jgi:hypothetical protein